MLDKQEDRMNADEQSIRNLVALWHSATTVNDIDTVLSLMAEDVIFLSAGNSPMQGRDTFGVALREVLQRCRIESTGEIKEISISGSLAYCWANLIVRLIPLAGGATLVRTGSAMSILCKQADGSWLVTRDANMLALVP
jgi:uncharacterized protein (TIGR02246 family)